MVVVRDILTVLAECNRQKVPTSVTCAQMSKMPRHAPVDEQNLGPPLNGDPCLVNRCVTRT